MVLGFDKYLRPLKLQDAQYMLEWMHDDTVVHDLKTDFSSKTVDDCISFIEQSKSDFKSIDLAIVDDNDEYMGTVSLKHISNEYAEFAIVVRKCAMGKGFSDFGMKSILNFAFGEYGLETVYWCVSVNNTRAIKFYDKHGFKETIDIPIALVGQYCEADALKWYFIDKFCYTNL